MFFGRAVELTVGWPRMLALYFLSGVVGGIFQMIGTWLFPGLFGDGSTPVIGASRGWVRFACRLCDVISPSEIISAAILYSADQDAGAGVFGCFGGDNPFPASFNPGSPAFDGESLAGVCVWQCGHAAHLGGMVTGLYSQLYWYGVSQEGASRHFPGGEKFIELRCSGALNFEPSCWMTDITCVRSIGPEALLPRA